MPVSRCAVSSFGGLIPWSRSPRSTIGSSDGSSIAHLTPPAVASIPKPSSSRDYRPIRHARLCRRNAQRTRQGVGVDWRSVFGGPLSSLKSVDTIGGETSRRYSKTIWAECLLSGPPTIRPPFHSIRIHFRTGKKIGLSETIASSLSEVAATDCAGLPMRGSTSSPKSPSLRVGACLFWRDFPIETDRSWIRIQWVRISPWAPRHALRWVFRSRGE